MSGDALKESGSDDGNALVPVWDVWVRLFHVALLTSVLFQLLSGLTGWQFFDWHRRVGEIVLALVTFRLLWGLFGSGNARLLALLRSPVAAFRSLGELVRRRSPPVRGHDAAGSWAVVALLTLLLVQAGTGMLIADEDEYIEGAWYGTLDSGLSDLLYRVHHINAELLQGLVVLHVSAVLIHLVWARRDLVRPMITGRMRWPSALPLPPLFLQRAWVGLPIAALVIAAIGYTSGWFG